MSTIAAGQTADRIDYWIRRHIIQCYGTHSTESQSKFNSARDRRVGLLAIGQCLKDQYDALATTMPGISLHSPSNSKRAEISNASISRVPLCIQIARGVIKKRPDEEVYSYEVVFVIS